MNGLRLRAVLVLIGFTAAIAQIVLLRELMVVFYGNEMSVGLALASWLFWTAAGSYLAGCLAVRPDRSHRVMAALEAIVSIVLPATILAVRTGKEVLQTVPGESLGPGPMLLTSLMLLSPFSIASGALFAVGSRFYADRSNRAAGEATGAVYLLETLGSAAGGVLAGLVLVVYLSPLQIAVGIGGLNLLAAAGLTIRARPLRRVAMAAVVAATVVLALPFGIPRLESASLTRFWKGFRLIAARNSAYGSLAVVETEGIRSVYENGLNLFNVPDPAAAEEAVHYALLEHPAPRTLLLIGGGVSGSITEALRHPTLKRVDYVELDPAILAIARDSFPGVWSAVAADPRVRVHIADGRLFVKTTGSTFDVIIVNLPDPQTAQLNRFYTVEFFREAAARLNPGGVFSFRLSGSEDYISPELAEFLRSIDKTLRTVFPLVEVMPGQTVHFFAAREHGVLAGSASELLARLRTRRLRTSYVREYYIPFRMTADRMSDLALQITPRPETPVNRDFAPVAYYFDIALWSSRFHHRYRDFFRVLADVPFGFVAAATAVMLAALAAVTRLRGGDEHRRRSVAAFSTAAMGFTLIGLEMLALLAFQAVYGSLYQQLALLIASFMAGMAMGTWLAMRRPTPGGVRSLALLQAAAAALPLLLCALFRVEFPALFPAAVFVCGLVGGYQFPIASQVFFQGSQRNPGTLYALDLAGSCAGAVLFSTWLIPVYGFFRTAALTAMVSFVPAVLAASPGMGRPAVPEDAPPRQTPAP